MVRIFFGMTVAWVVAVGLTTWAASAVAAKPRDFPTSAAGSPPACFASGRTGEPPRR